MSIPAKIAASVTKRVETIAAKRLDVDKIIAYFQEHTNRATDTLEHIISRLDWPEEDLKEAREVLDRCREHLSGFKGPMVWQTEKESTRYVKEQNRDYRGDTRYSLKLLPGQVLVIPPNV